MKITTILLTGFFALTRPAAAQDEAGKDLVQLRAGRTSGERAAAAMRLGSVRNIDAVRPLVEALEDEKSVVQRQAMAALGEICSASGAKSGDCAGLAVPALQRKAVSADNEIKSRALKTLAKLGVKPASTAGALAADPPASLRKSPPDYLIKTLAELKPADIAHSTVPKAYICPPELKVALDKDHTCHTHIIDDSPDWSLPMPPDGCTLGKWGLGSLQLTGMEVYGSPNGDKTAPMEHLLCHYFSPDKKYTPPAKVRTAPEGLTCKVTSTDTFSCMPLAKFHCPAELTLLSSGHNGYEILFPKNWSYYVLSTRMPLRQNIPLGQKFVLPLKGTMALLPYLVCRYEGPEVEWVHISRPYPEDMFCGVWPKTDKNEFVCAYK